MLGDKRIFMELGDGADFESSKSTEPKKEIQEQVQDFALDETLEKLLGGVELLDVTGGIATIAMPLQMLKMLSMFGELFKNHENEKGISL